MSESNSTSSFTPKRRLPWLDEILRSHGYNTCQLRDNVIDRFEQEQIDQHSFFHLSEQDFIDLGVPLGPRKIFTEIVSGEKNIMDEMTSYEVENKTKYSATPSTTKVNHEEFYLGEDTVFDPHNFQTGIFDCFLDVESCCSYTWSPASGYSQIAFHGYKEADYCESMKLHFSPFIIIFTLFFPLIMCVTLSNSSYSIIRRYQIADHNRPSTLVTICCSCCRACQIHREIVIRGRNPQSEWIKDDRDEGKWLHVNAVSRCCIGGYVEKDRLLWPSGYGNVYKVEGRYHRPKAQVMGPTAEMKLEIASAM